MTLQFDPAALAASVTPPTRMMIGGRAVESASGKTFATYNPATGEELAQIAEGSQEDMDRAVAAARDAFDNGPWGRMAPADRRALLKRFALLIEAHADELAVMETLEAGKPIFDSSTIDLPESFACLMWHAELADKVYDLATPSGPGVVSTVVREPVGVVGAVLPWNYPLMMASWKIGPALAAGNTMVLKPAEQTSMSTIRIAELATEAGLPSLGSSASRPVLTSLIVDPEHLDKSIPVLVGTELSQGGKGLLCFHHVQSGGARGGRIAALRLSKLHVSRYWGCPQSKQRMLELTVPGREEQAGTLHLAMGDYDSLSRLAYMMGREHFD